MSPLQRSKKRINGLGTRHSIFAIEDKERYAGDADLIGLFEVGGHLGSEIGSAEHFFNGCFVQSNSETYGCEGRNIVYILAIGEIGLENMFFRFRGKLDKTYFAIELSFNLWGMSS